MPPTPVPVLPSVGVPPVDQVLTQAQAVVQCGTDGLSLLLDTAAFNQCVKKYTTP